MDPPGRITGSHGGGWRRRAHDRAALARWHAWTVRRPALRGGHPVFLGPRTTVDVAHGGSLDRGRNVVARAGVTMFVRGRLVLGDSVFIGPDSLIGCRTAIRIGAHVRIAERVSIHDADHMIEPLSDVDGRSRDYLVAPVIIGERVWLAANVVVLSGVTIGADTVVGAGSVVTRDLPAGVLAAGAPARIIRPLAA